MESMYCRITLIHTVLDVGHIGALEQAWNLIINRNWSFHNVCNRFVMPFVAPFSGVLSFAFGNVTQLDGVSEPYVSCRH
jgi:hypothetical protein